ncbi:hypothetical protein A2U01_0081441, partial [Trifolium medium]|nr:hypothetical protein [Trifolium medium]
DDIQDRRKWNPDPDTG